MNDQDLDGLLSELPTTTPVPPGLDEAVLRGIAETPQHRPSRWWIAVAAAAALAVGAGLGSAMQPEPTLLLTAGSQLVEGRALVLAGDREVRVDGTALISVEPPADFLRENEQEANHAMIDKTHAIAALAGSFVTIAVYHGTAVVSGADVASEPITVHAGEEKSVGAPSPAPTPVVRRIVREAPAPTVSMSVDERDPEAVIAELRSELAGLRTQQSLSEGQLAAVQGEAQPWPEDIEELYRPAAFERAMRTAVADEGAGDVLVVDCSEFPCLTVLKPGPYDGQGTSPEIQAVIDRLSALLGDSGISVHNSRSGDGETDLLLTGLSFTPKDSQNEELATRNGWRMEGHLKGITEDLMGSPDEEDVEVQ
jgi:hypothetical protein